MEQIVAGGEGVKGRSLDTLDLAAAGVATDARAFIRVNECLETNVLEIWEVDAIATKIHHTSVQVLMCCGIWWRVREIDPGNPVCPIAPKDAFDCLAEPMVATIGEGKRCG